MSPPPHPKLDLLLPAGDSDEACRGVLLEEPTRGVAGRGRMLGVPPVGVNPSESRMVPAEEGGDAPVTSPDIRGSSVVEAMFGSDRTCHRSEVEPGRASRGAMLMAAYLMKGGGKH